MHIESGTTAWWRNRNLMFLAMFLGVAAWFAYDGYIKYPSKNLEWAAQAMEVSPSEIQTNPRVVKSALAQLEADLKAKGTMTYEELVAEFKDHLGEPALVRNNEHWWVGPAIYIKTSPRERQPVLQESSEYRESSVRGQRWFAGLLLVLGLLVALNLVRILMTKVVLDDNGLRYNKRHIPWEAMTGLRRDDFARKGWVDVEYTSNGAARHLRLDSFHIEKFNEIVNAICERKGFPPLTTAADNQDESADETSPEA